MTHIAGVLYFMLGLLAGLILEGLVEDECNKSTVTPSAIDYRPLPTAMAPHKTRF